MSLLAAAIETHGIATTCIVLLREIAEKVRPPRALFVPFAHGYPLGAANETEMQLKVIRAALGLLGDRGPAPLLAPYTW